MHVWAVLLSIGCSLSLSALSYMAHCRCNAHWSRDDDDDDGYRTPMRKRYHINSIQLLLLFVAYYTRPFILPLPSIIFRGRFVNKAKFSAPIRIDTSLCLQCPYMPTCSSSFVAVVWCIHNVQAQQTNNNSRYLRSAYIFICYLHQFFSQWKKIKFT